MNSRPIASRTGVRVGAAALAAVVLVTGTVLAVTRPWEPPSGPPPCPPAAYQATQSVARRWDDALLDAIRRALPNPPVHARNLFHVSVAMWDAWAAYDPTAMGYLFKEKLNVDRCDVGAARNEAISYAAYRVLTGRVIKAVGAEQSVSEFADLMDTLSYPTSLTTTDGDTPAAVGNRIAKMVLEYGLADGSNEANGYAAPNYKPVNPPLVVALPDIRIVDPNRWQPLQVEFLLSQTVAEFCADGPNSETPPGHWNVIANTVSDALAPNLRIGGQGPVVDRLEWDVKLYLALNGAVHDAAIAAWGLKGRYDGIRPISMIRYMASLGQSSDPALASYNKEGLPLVPGLVELITKDKTANGGPMPSLRGNEGKIAVRAWHRGLNSPAGGSVDWILGTTWTPYQLQTFVTPSFPGYISGHSTFSRAAAEVMTGITGTEYFPGGLSEWTVKAGSFRIDTGPGADVSLQWATYYDAADQAGQSRIFGGIHIQADDFTGRMLGSTCGQGG